MTIENRAKRQLRLDQWSSAYFGIDKEVKVVPQLRGAYDLTTSCVPIHAFLHCVAAGVESDPSEEVEGKEGVY